MKDDYTGYVPQRRGPVEMEVVVDGREEGAMSSPNFPVLSPLSSLLQASSSSLLSHDPLSSCTATLVGSVRACG